jgi:hypothetical protein
VKVVEEVSEPDVPVIVTVLLPMLAPLLAVKVRIVLVATGLGKKNAVTPLGRPVTARFTSPLKPY